MQPFMAMLPGLSIIGNPLNLMHIVLICTSILVSVIALTFQLVWLISDLMFIVSHDSYAHAKGDFDCYLEKKRDVG